MRNGLAFIIMGGLIGIGFQNCGVDEGFEALPGTSIEETESVDLPDNQISPRESTHDPHRNSFSREEIDRLVDSAQQNFSSPNESVTIFVASGAHGVGTFSDPAALSSEVAAAASLLQSSGRAVTIKLMPGDYFLPQPIVIPSSSAASSITKIVYESFDPVDPARLSGALSFKTDACNWSVHDERLALTVWKCRLPDVITSYLSRHPDNLINTVYMNSRRLIRSRHPNHDAPIDVIKSQDDMALSTEFRQSLLVSQSSFGDLSEIITPPDASHPSAVEFAFTFSWRHIRALVYRLVATESDSQRYFRVRFSGNMRLSLQVPPGNWPRMSGNNPWMAFPEERGHFENHLSFVDSVDEWFVDHRNNFIFLASNENPQLSSSVISVSINDKLILLSGSQEQPVSHVEIRNLTLQYTGHRLLRDGVKSDHYFAIQGGCTLPGAIDGKWVKDLVIANNHFRGIGFYGASLGGSRSGFCNSGQGTAKRIIISNNSFSDMGAGAVRIDDRLDLPPDPRDPPVGAPRQYERSSILVSHNQISSLGRIFYDTIPIAILSATDAHVVDNTIDDAPYSGISMGFFCRYTKNDLFYVARNRVLRTMRRLNDGGAIYTAGGQGIIEHNIVDDVGESSRMSDAPTATESYFVNGIYIDRDSILYNIRNNDLRTPRSRTLLVKSRSSQYKGQANRFLNVWEFFGFFNDHSTASPSGEPCVYSEDKTPIDFSDKPSWWN